MKRTPVAAATLRSVGYAPCASILEVEFSGGEVCQYLGVPTSVHDGLMAAASKDGFFDEHIRESYAYRQISPPTASV
jgi:hypothetical protein